MNELSFQDSIPTNEEMNIKMELTPSELTDVQKNVFCQKRNQFQQRGGFPKRNKK